MMRVLPPTFKPVNKLIWCKTRLVPSRYLSVFWGERRLGIRLRCARGLMGRDEGKIARLNLIPNLLSAQKTLK